MSKPWHSWYTKLLNMSLDVPYFTHRTNIYRYLRTYLGTFDKFQNKLSKRIASKCQLAFTSALDTRLISQCVADGNVIVTFNIMWARLARSFERSRPLSIGKRNMGCACVLVRRLILANGRRCHFVSIDSSLTPFPFPTALSSTKCQLWY